MKIKLYKPFEHWYHGGSIWVFSDLHFEDSDCKLMDPNWPTPEEQVKLINSKVGKKDTLIILGDVGNVEWVKKLKGYKVLVMGNHDKGASNYRKTGVNYLCKKENLTVGEVLVKYKDEVFVNGDLIVEDNHLFDEVYEGPVFINEKILLSHEPIKLPFGINIHGHDHAGVKKTTYANETTMLNVAANVIDYMPIRIDKLIEGADYIDIHRTTIDKAIVRKSKRNKC